MAYDPEKHHRRSIRLPGYDYRRRGAYFITICTTGRACVFGEVVNDEVKLSRRGMIATECWNDIPNHRPYVELDQFIVMPNHVHGLVWILDSDERRATQASPLQGPRLVPGSLGAIVGAYKAAVSRNINKIRPGAAVDLWQPNYYEHIVRDERALVNIREYIVSNPLAWADDAENPEGTGKNRLEDFFKQMDAVYAALKKGDASVAPTKDVTPHD